MPLKRDACNKQPSPNPSETIHIDEGQQHQRENQPPLMHADPTQNGLRLASENVFAASAYSPSRGTQSPAAATLPQPIPKR